MNNMKVISFNAVKEVIISSVEIPGLSADEILVEIEYSFISAGTEKWFLLDLIKMSGDGHLKYPFVPGYQATGIVRDIGANVKDHMIGDRVFSKRCKKPEMWKGDWLGGHAQYHVADKNSIIKIPKEISLRSASGLSLAQVGYNGATKPRINKGDIVVIVGDGLVGQYAAQVIKHREAYVILAGHHKERLELAAGFGADETLNTNEVDLNEYIQKKYSNNIDIVIDTTGKRDIVRKLLEFLKYEGQLVLLGYYPQNECEIDIHWLRNKEAVVYSPNNIKKDRLEETLKLLVDKKMFIEELITHEYYFEDAKKAFDMILENKDKYLGILINWMV